jgi:hypothetical protein
VKGGILIFVALVIGVLLLNQGSDSGDAATASTAPDQSGDTTPTSADDSTDGTTATTANTTTSEAGARPPEEVMVLVANASGIPGAAAEVEAQLVALGYQAPDDGATNASTPATTTTVYYIAGFEAEAAAVAEDLGLAPADAVAGEVPSPVPTTDGSMRGANILVILGPDVAPTSSGGGTTTTTAAGSGTTVVAGST